MDHTTEIEFIDCADAEVVQQQFQDSLHEWAACSDEFKHHLEVEITDAEICCTHLRGEGNQFDNNTGHVGYQLYMVKAKEAGKKIFAYYFQTEVPLPEFNSAEEAWDTAFDSVDVKWENTGIGRYEFWGQKCNDVKMAQVIDTDTATIELPNCFLVKGTRDLGSEDEYQVQAKLIAARINEKGKLIGRYHYTDDN
ncbi:MAG: hypothetical protein WCY09_08155 [Candidatus Omnitrophota bacterium]